MKHSVYISHVRKLKRKLAESHFNKKKRFMLAHELSSYIAKYQAAAMQDWMVNHG